MSTPGERISRWSRRFAAVGALFFLVWSLGAVFGIPARTGTYLGVFGFVFHTIFAKGYSLIPTYFDRTLVSAWLPVVQFPLSVFGTLCLAVGSLDSASTGSVIPTATTGGLPLEALGATLWACGIVVFVGGLLWSVRDNPTGSETATGEHNRHRRSIDRLSNVFVPIALLYLLFGSYVVLASETSLPPVFDGYRIRGIHLLVTGTATLLVFAIGFFLPLFAAFEAIAIVGYSTVIAVLTYRSKTIRIGLYGVLFGSIWGVVGIALGLWLAVGGLDPTVVAIHRRTNLLGFLGLTIVGVSYQFYPPTTSQYPGGGNRAAALSIVAVTGALGFEIVGLAFGFDRVLLVGRFLSFLGALVYVYLLSGVFASR